MFFPALHIPDGFLSLPVSLVGWILLIAMLSVALRQTRDTLGERQVPLMGILAAFVFAGQMINFPVAGGTSGHLLGGALIAILVGPWAGIIVMTAVASIQALMFQDGGLLAMGFNIFNMGIITVFAGYTIYELLNRSTLGVFLGAWIGVELAAVATALQLAVSGTSPLNIALPAMIGVHALIGIGEGLITVGALGFIRQSRPDLLNQETASRGAGWVVVGLAISLMIVFFSPLASSDPDGLERVASDKGFIEAAEDSAYNILPDYTVSFIEDEDTSTILAGVIGVIIVSGATYTLARSNHRRNC